MAEELLQQAAAPESTQACQRQKVQEKYESRVEKSVGEKSIVDYWFYFLYCNYSFFFSLLLLFKASCISVFRKL